MKKNESELWEYDGHGTNGTKRPWFCQHGATIQPMETGLSGRPTADGTADAQQWADEPTAVWTATADGTANHGHDATVIGFDRF